MPRPSCQRILIRSPRRPRNTNKSPAWGSRRSPSCTCSASPFMPRRMSVCPVAIHTRTPERIGIIGAQRPDHRCGQFGRRRLRNAQPRRAGKLDLDRWRRVQCGTIVAAVVHRRNDDLGKSVTGVAQLLPPTIDLPGTNRRTPGDIDDDRARRKGRSDNRRFCERRAPNNWQSRVFIGSGLGPAGRPGTTAWYSNQFPDSLFRGSHDTGSAIGVRHSVIFAAGTRAITRPRQSAKSVPLLRRHANRIKRHT